MVKTQNEFIKDWERATENLAQYFARRYFIDDFCEDDEPEMWWVADEIGGVLHINDHFFNLKDIVDFIRYDYSKKKMFEYYEYALDCRTKEKDYIINIKNYKKLK